MKAITLRQPYAEFVKRGDKRIETRNWRTPYRGPLAIHAAVTLRNPAHGERDTPFDCAGWRIIPTLARMERQAVRGATGVDQLLSEPRVWLSPNGVDHQVVRGRCVTCGRTHPESGP